MGTFIDGDDTSLPATLEKLHKRKTAGSPSGLRLCAFILFGFSVVVVAMLQQQSEMSRAATAAAFDGSVGTCFSTRVGAVGMVTSADPDEEEVTLIFKSGIRQAYPLGEVIPSPCP